MNKRVIIGAGQSGRGYINRLFALSNENVTFIDKDEKLIEKLNKTSSYTISFGSQGRDCITIHNYDAYSIQDKEALIALANADTIFISVGNTHVKELVPLLKESLALRKQGHVDIITAENGIHPASVLEDLKCDNRVHVSESIIFCTTLGNENTLDILSEDLDHLPYDIVALGHALPYTGMVKEEHFPHLLQRKIYTYNCLSACVAYLGYEKNYTDYAKAANDPSINEAMHAIAKAINEAVVHEYHVTKEEQNDFSTMAIRKFQNVDIIDTIERNVRDVSRKLASNERMIAPLMMIAKYQGTCEELLHVVACALYYGYKEEGFHEHVDEVIKNYTSMLCDEWQTTIRNDLMKLLNK